MDRWNGKIAVVVGVGGVGSAIAATLLKNGLVIVGIDQNEKHLEHVSSENFHPMKCDVTKETDVVTTFDMITAKFGGVDLLVNSAGYLNFSSLTDGSAEVWKQILDTNVMGMSLCSREALKTLKNREYGHIINLNSITGHSINIGVFPDAVGMYPISKYAVTALCKCLRVELRNAGSTARITSISPGLVHTNMGSTVSDHVKYSSDTDEGVPKGFLIGQDVADVIVNVISMNPRVEIQEVTMQTCWKYF